MLAAAACSVATLAGFAQYPGHVSTKVDAPPVLRAIAVLEWTGDAGKPKASRLVPVSVFSGGEFQAGGLYLARPWPLALEGGTEYQLMLAGLPKGDYDVAMAEKRFGEWFGYGAWKPLPPPEAVHKLQPSKIDPEVVDGGGDSDRRPHFRKAAPEASSPATPENDPDRPTLKKHNAAQGAEADANSSAPSKTATATGDPDRPRLSHNGRKDDPADMKQLEGTPADMQQIVAVSDAATRPAHSFAYSFANPEDAGKLQAQVEAIALKAIAAAPAVKKPIARTSAHTTTQAHASAQHVATAHRTPKKTSSTTLTDVQFNAFELTYSGGATVVLTARTAGDEAQAHYVTVIAQPDIYGVPQVLFTQITRLAELDSSPRFRLIDAVDAAADNRGELLFELRGAKSRQFALYRVAGGRVDAVMTTGALAMSASAAAE